MLKDCQRAFVMILQLIEKSTIWDFEIVEKQIQQFSSKHSKVQQSATIINWLLQNNLCFSEEELSLCPWIKKGSVINLVMLPPLFLFRIFFISPKVLL